MSRARADRAEDLAFAREAFSKLGDYEYCDSGLCAPLRSHEIGIFGVVGANGLLVAQVRRTWMEYTATERVWRPVVLDASNPTCEIRAFQLEQNGLVVRTYGGSWPERLCDVCRRGFRDAAWHCAAATPEDAPSGSAQSFEVPQEVLSSGRADRYETVEGPLAIDDVGSIWRVMQGGLERVPTPRCFVENDAQAWAIDAAVTSLMTRGASAVEWRFVPLHGEVDALRAHLTRGFHAPFLVTDDVVQVFTGVARFEISGDGQVRAHDATDYEAVWTRGQESNAPHAACAPPFTDDVHGADGHFVGIYGELVLFGHSAPFELDSRWQIRDLLSHTLVMSGSIESEVRALSLSQTRHLQMTAAPPAGEPLNYLDPGQLQYLRAFASNGPDAFWLSMGERTQIFVRSQEQVELLPSPPSMRNEVLTDLILVGDELLVTSNRGRVHARNNGAWSTSTINTQTSLVALAADGDVVFAVGARGTIARREQGTWHRERAGVNHALMSIAALNGRVVVGGARGTLLERIDGRWRALRSPTRKAITSIALEADGTLYLAAGQAVFRRRGEGPWRAITFRCTEQTARLDMNDGVHIWPPGDWGRYAPEASDENWRTLDAACIETSPRCPRVICVSF